MPQLMSLSVIKKKKKDYGSKTKNKNKKAWARARYTTRDELWVLQALPQAVNTIIWSLISHSPKIDFFLDM